MTMLAPTSVAYGLDAGQLTERRHRIPLVDRVLRQHEIDTEAGVDRRPLPPTALDALARLTGPALTDGTDR